MGKKKSAKTAAAPDYTALGEKTMAMQKQNTLEALTANRANQTNQFGSIDWNRDPTTGAWTQTESYNPQQQALLDQQVANQSILGQKAGGMLGNIDYSYGNAPAAGQVGGFNQQATDLISKGAPLDQVMAFIDNSARELKTRTQRVNELDKNILTAVTEMKKQHPELDEAALLSLARHDASYKRDANGDYQLNDMASVDPNKQWVMDAYNRNSHNLYPEDAAVSNRNKLLETEKLEKRTQLPTYDPKTGNRIEPGYDGNVPSQLVDVVPDPKNKGKYITQVKSEVYKLPGSKDPYVDNNGNPVKVLPESLFKKYYNADEAVRAQIDRKVNRELEKAANFDGSGESNFSPDSEYANMLRRKFTYDSVESSVNGRYTLDTPKDESDARRNQIRDNQRSDESLALARKSSQLALAKFNYQKLKDEKKNPTVDDITPLTVSIAETSGEDVGAAEYVNGKWEPRMKRFVNIDNIDAKDLEMIKGKDGVEPVKIERKGKEVSGYFVTADGDWIGEEDKVIKKERVVDDQLKYFTKDDLPASSKGVRGTIKSAINKVFTPKTEKPAKSLFNLSASKPCSFSLFFISKDCFCFSGSFIDIGDPPIAEPPYGNSIVALSSSLA